jgi:DNA repair protein RecN (Recombination protein N)
LGEVELLLELSVKDLAIFEDIEWKLDEGLNVITGQTGAGKSLIIDAVELLLTGTFSDDLIRHGATESHVEGIFCTSKDNSNSILKSILDTKEITLEDDTLIISCEIRRGKPGVIRINGHPVTRSILRQIGEVLIDIHGQSDHLSLLDKKSHIDFLDSYARLLDLRDNFAAKVHQLNVIDSEIISLSQRDQNAARQEEFLRYQIEEIKQAGLQEKEDEYLEKEHRILSFSETLKDYSNRVYQALYDSDSAQFSGSALTKLNDAVQALKKLVELDPALSKHLEILDKSVYSLEEVARDIHSYGQKLEEDPARREEIESRMEQIRNLKRKYGNTITDILNYRSKAEIDLETFSQSSDKLERLNREREGLKSEMGLLGLELSQMRSRAAVRLTVDVKKELEDLEMAQMQFEISILRNPSSEGIKGPEGCFAFSNSGIDNIEFMVSTNPGEPLKPLAKIASTGEISRFTLALKSSLSEADNIPVLIFDEIDIGIGGRSGETIGKKLWSLARKHQVICITHLPQIAAYADAHVCIQKSISGKRTTSTLEKLSDNLRLNELASMLTGPDYSQTTLQDAAELMKKAETWKKR